MSKARLIDAAHYLIGLAREASTYRGLIWLMTAGSWAALDGSNKGEIMAAGGMALAGLVQIFLPQRILYGIAAKPDTEGRNQ